MPQTDAATPPPIGFGNLEEGIGVLEKAVNELCIAVDTLWGQSLSSSVPPSQAPSDRFAALYYKITTLAAIIEGCVGEIHSRC